MSRHQPLFVYTRAAMWVLFTAVVAAGCSTTGPDASTTAPRPGTTFLVSMYETTPGRDTIPETHVLAFDTVRSNELTIAGMPNAVQSTRDTIGQFRPDTSYIRQFSNGDVAVYEQGYAVPGFPFPNRWVTYPFGRKLTLTTTTVLDTTWTELRSGGEDNIHHVVSTMDITFQGPSEMLLNGEAVTVLKIDATQETTYSQTQPISDSTVYIRNIQRWYAPSLGYFVREDVATAVQTLSGPEWDRGRYWEVRSYATP